MNRYTRRMTLKTAGMLAGVAALSQVGIAKADTVVVDWHDVGFSISGEPSTIFGVWTTVWSRLSNGSPSVAEYDYNWPASTMFPHPLSGTLAPAAIVASDLGGYGGVARFSDGLLRYAERVPSGTWTAWQEVGGGRQFSTDPVNWSDHGPYRIAGMTTDNTIWANNGQWKSLSRFTQPSYGFAAAVTGSRVDLFMANKNGIIYRATAKGSATWDYWWAEMGPVQGTPTAVSPGDNTVRVFARSTSNKLVMRTLNLTSNNLSQTDEFSDAIYADPVAVKSPGRIDVFYRGTSGIYQRTMVNGSWQAPVFRGGTPFWNPGNTIADHRPTVTYDPSRNRFAIFVRGSNDRLWHLGIQRQ